MRCTHQFEVIYRGDSNVLMEDVVRWCRLCGAVVVDIDYDGRTNPGGVLKMRFPESARKT